MQALLLRVNKLEIEFGKGGFANWHGTPMIDPEVEENVSTYRCGFGGLAEWFNDPMLDPEIWKLIIRRKNEIRSRNNHARRHKRTILH